MLLLTLVAAFAIRAALLAVHDVGSLELDGNAVSDVFDDWQNVWLVQASQTVAAFVLNRVSTPRSSRRRLEGSAGSQPVGLEGWRGVA
jgi:hypothetical protein